MKKTKKALMILGSILYPPIGSVLLYYYMNNFYMDEKVLNMHKKAREIDQQYISDLEKEIKDLKNLLQKKSKI